MKTAIVVTTLVCLGLITLPLAIAMTVIGAMQHSTCHNNGVNVTVNSNLCTCDVTDPLTNLNVSQYLLGLGILNVIFVVILMITIGISLCSESFKPYIPMLVIGVVAGLFGTAWFIVGGITLFNSNIQCIKLTVSHVIFALVMWCLSALHIVQTCCNGVTHKKN